MPITPAQEEAALPWLLSARSEERLGRVVGAVEALRRGTSARPDNPVLHARLGVRLRAAGRYQEAVASLRNAQRLAPDDPYVLVELGNALRFDGRLEDALRIHEPLLRRFPDRPEVVLAWAGDLALLGEPDRPLARAREVAEAHPLRLDGPLTVARLYIGLGRHREALRLAEDAVGKEPRAYSAYTLCAQARRGLGRAFGEDVRRMVALNEGAGTTLHWRGALAEADGDDDGATFWWREALQRHARDGASSLGLAGVLERRGEIDEARDRYAEAAAIGLPGARGAWLRFRVAHGEPGLALARVEQEARRRPYTGLLQALARIAWELRGDLPAAMTLIDTAARLLPEDAPTWRLYASIAAGRPEGIEAEARIAALATG